MDVDKAISTAVKTGKVVFGVKEAKESVKTGKAKLIVLANNTPDRIREDLEHYGMLSQIPIVTYKSDSVDLGITCGRRYTVSTLTIKDPGDSDILKWSTNLETEKRSNEEEAGEI